MSESVDFILKLNDQVSGAARSAADSLRKMQGQGQAAQMRMLGIENAARKMNAAIDSAKVNVAAKALAHQASEAAKAERAMRGLIRVQEQAAKMDAQRTRERSFVGGVKGALGLNGIGGKFASGAFWGDIAANAAMGIASGFVSGAKAAVGLVTDGIVGAFREGGKREDLQLSYKYLRGGVQGAKESLDDADRFSKKTRFDDDDILMMMRPLFKAGMNQKQARTAFASAADADATNGMDPNEMIGQYAKIMMKGGVTIKALQDIVNIPDFQKTLAKRLGVSPAQAMKLAEKPGGVNPSLLIKTIQDMQEKRQGAGLGIPAVERGSTMSARLNKLQNLPDQFLKAAVDSPAWKPLEDKMGEVLGALDPGSERGKKIVDALLGTFKTVAESINDALTPENLNDFTAAIKEIVFDVNSMTKGLIATAQFIRHPLDTTSDSIAKRLAEDDSSSKVRMLRDVNNSGMSTAAQMREAVNALTPSEKADLLAGDDGDQYRQYINAKAPRVNSVSPSDSAGPKQPQVLVQITGGINVTASDKSTPEEHAEEVAKHLAKHVESHVSRSMERAAMMSGGS